MYQLNLEKIGTGRNILFLPGITGTLNYWKPFLAPYTAKACFILIDPLGFGKSPKPKITYSIESHVEAIYHTVKDEAPFTIAGHSMGSILALHFAKAHPELVERVILIGLPFFQTEKTALQYFLKQKKYALTNPLLAKTACFFLRQIAKAAAPFFKTNSRTLTPEIVNEMITHTSRSFSSSLWEVIYRSNIRDLSKALTQKIPITCLHGEHDTSAPIQNVAKLIDEEHIDWTLYTKEKATHQIFLEYPDWCMNKILHLSP